MAAQNRNDLLQGIHVKIRLALLTASAFVLAAACTPAANEPAPATPEAAPIVEPAAPPASGPAAENTPDSLASAPAAATAPAAPAATPTPAAPAAADPSAAQLAEGRSTFAQSCAMCHGPAGLGTPMGVALTNGLEAAVIKEKITKGMINPGDKMPPMGAALSASQLESLSQFVAAGLPQG